MGKKKDHDIRGLPPFLEKALSKFSKEDMHSRIHGVASGHLIESIPSFIKSESEEVLANKNNAFIVLGRDRPKSRVSGYGGAGNTQCGTVDIVTGRLGSTNTPALDTSTGEPLYVDPDFEKDAARIYVSQKTDIDENFKLVPTPSAPTSTGRASIGIKADTIRMIARENIRIVTEGPVINSQGGVSQSIGGIDLVAGNMDNPGDPNLSIQPLVKGDNLSTALMELINQQEALNGIVNALLTFQGDLNSAIMTHFHHSPFYGAPTSPSQACLTTGAKTVLSHFSKVKTSLLEHKQNLVNLKFQYLFPSGDEYICSRFNSTN